MHDDHVGQRLKTYTFSRKLGEGAWARVYEVYDEKTRSQVACKVIPKRLMEDTPKLKELVQTEIKVLQECNSENVIKYIDTLSNDKNVYIFMEYCNGGDMETYLEKKKYLPEDEAREFLKQILNGFKGLHEVEAMHRDFKAANVLLHNGVAKIADLGFAKIMTKKMTGTVLGTCVTMAPEVLENKKYGFECDVWSVGVVYFQFLTGKYPYSAINDHEVLKKIKSGPPVFPNDILISEDSKTFIRRCLTVDPKQRISWADIYEHPLMVGKKNNVRQTYVGGLASQISIGKNKEFYDKRQNHQGPQDFRNITFQFEKANLTEAEDITRIQEELSRKKEIEQSVQQYSRMYLEMRNKIMLILKYAIVPIFEELGALPFGQQLYAFLMCKRAFLDMKDFLGKVQRRENLFGLYKHLAEFGASKEYTRIQEQVKGDLQIIQAYALSLIGDVNGNNAIRAELNLDVATPNFKNLLRQSLQSYSFLLYDYRNSSAINKSTLVRVMAFVSDLANGTVDKMTSEQYDRRMETLNTSQTEAQFDQKLKALYS